MICSECGALVAVSAEKYCGGLDEERTVAFLASETILTS